MHEETASTSVPPHAQLIQMGTAASVRTFVVWTSQDLVETAWGRYDSNGRIVARRRRRTGFPDGNESTVLRSRRRRTAIKTALSTRSWRIVGLAAHPIGFCVATVVAVEWPRIPRSP